MIIDIEQDYTITYVNTPYNKQGGLTEILISYMISKEEDLWQDEQLFINKYGEIVARFVHSLTDDGQGYAEQLSNKRQDLFVVTKKRRDFKNNTDGLYAIIQVKDNEYRVLHEYNGIAPNPRGDIFVVKRGLLYGYMDADGVEIIEPQYSVAERFSDGIAIVKKNGFIGAINKSNEIVVPLEYTKSDFIEFTDGYCAFKLPMSAGINLWHILNKKGEIVFENKGDINNLGFGNFLISKNDKCEIIKFRDNGDIN